MIESNITSVTPLTANTDSVIFPNTSIRTCSSTCRGWLNFSEGSANYDILEGGLYEVDVNLTASSASAGVIAFALYKNGEMIPGTLMAETLAAAGDYANVGVESRIRICCKGDANISVRSVPAVPTPTDPTTPIATQIPIVISGNISIARLS